MFDAHLRPSAIGPRDVADLRWFGVVGALCPLSLPAPAAATAPALRKAWEELECAARRLRRAGLHALVALSIPPGSVPRRGTEALLAELPDGLSRPGVAAIGPVGPGASPREEEIFGRQLEMARELRRPLVVAVPARDPVRVLRRALAAVRECGLPPDRVLVDGVDARTVRVVRALGHCAVLDVPPGRAGLDATARLVRTLGPEGLAFASHAGDGTGDLLALPRAADRLSRLGLSAAVIRRVCGRNALEALGVPAGALPGADGPSARSGRRTSR